MSNSKMDDYKHLRMYHSETELKVILVKFVREHGIKSYGELINTLVDNELSTDLIDVAVKNPEFFNTYLRTRGV